MSGNRKDESNSEHDFPNSDEYKENLDLIVLLAEGETLKHLQDVDAIARRRGITFYQQVMEMDNRRAKDEGDQD